MGLETGTYISDLVTTNPVTGDPISQGDNHIQLLKTVLQNTFPGANRAFPIPTSVAKSADYVILATDQNKVIYVNTTAAARTLTLPSLTSAEYGWSVTIVKSTTDTNPVFIIPASGTIISGDLQSLSKVRRCIPDTPFRCMWNEGSWIIERCVRVPLLSVLPFFGVFLPVGYEWPNGQTLSSSANYPEYNTARGGLTTPDLRQRTLVGTNLGGADPGRIGTILAAALESVGGVETVALTEANLAAHTHTSGTLATSSETAAHTHTISGNTGNITANHVHNGPALATTTAASGGGVTVVTGYTAGVDGSGQTSNDTTNHQHASVGGTLAADSGGAAHTHTISGSTGSAGSGTAHSNVQPSITTNFILVVE